MTLVFPSDPVSADAGVHAIVVGIGHYRHLPGGDDEEYPKHEGMSQLSSPPISARHIADWLLDTYRNDADRPLRSLELLISERGGQAAYSNASADLADVPIDEATLANVARAIKDWKRRGESSADNLLIFYFCGHGISAGLQHTLLCTDFGADHDAPLTTAINFTDFHLGMDKCAAREQCYFVDACRVASTELIESVSFKGQPVVYGTAKLTKPSRAAPVYHAAMPGVEGWGLNNRPSAFAQALPRAFKGAAWKRRGGRWVVDANQLNSALDVLVAHIMRVFKALDKRVEASSLSRINLKNANGEPVVPVEITCDPNSANSVAQLSYESPPAARQVRNAQSGDSWYVELERGEYNFAASFEDDEFVDRNVDEYVFPPDMPVVIEV